MGVPRKPFEEDDSLPLLEREHELGVIAQAVADAGRGTGSLCMVEGPSGIGKSTLLSHAASIAGEAGFLVRAARGGELERDMPFGVVRQLFEPLVERASEEERTTWLSGSASQALAALGKSESQGSESASDPFGSVNALYWLVANLAVSRPVLLTVDDAQWVDTASLRFLTFLARRLSELPVGVIAAVRTGEPSDPSALGLLRAESVSVQPRSLSLASVSELITRRTGGLPSPEFSAACRAASAGNPFLVNEILHEFRLGGQKLDGEAAASIATLVPENVVRTVLVRLDRFGRDTAAVARAIAVLGRSPQLRHAAHLAGLDEDAARSAIDHLRSAEILAPGTPIDFVHPVVRQAIYRSQPEERRSATHRIAAELLARTGAPSEEVAAQLLACTPNGDAWVAERLQEAARAAFEEGALDAAATYLERALQEPPENDLPVRYHLAIALMTTDVFRAPQVLSEVADRTVERSARVQVLRRLVSAHAQAGNLAAAGATCDEALDAVGTDSREVTLSLEAERYFMVVASRGREHSDSGRIETVASGLVGATPGERAARQALAIDRFLDCAPVAETVALTLPIRDGPLQEIEGFPSPIVWSPVKILAWSGRWREPREAVAEWAEAFHRLGRPLGVSLANSLLSEIDRLGGRLREAESEARTAWEIARYSEGSSSYGWSALMNLGAALLARGDVDGLLELVGESELSAGPTEIPLNPWPIELRAHLRLEQGNLEGAVRDLLALGESLERIGWFNPAYPPWRQEAGEALTALGRTAEAEEVVAIAEQRAERFGAPHTIASVLRSRALLEPRRRGIETLRRSVELLEAGGPAHELTTSLISLGGALRRAGDRGDARDSLHRALELAHSCGSGSLERRAREELAAAGARPRRPVRTGVGSLTASELKTATLAAGGLSNKEIAERLFVTVRTVETHLTHVYEKLGIAGRRGLSTALSAGG